MSAKSSLAEQNRFPDHFLQGSFDEDGAAGFLRKNGGVDLSLITVPFRLSGFDTAVREGRLQTEDVSLHIRLYICRPILR